MLRRVLTGIAVFLIAAVLIITALPLTNEWVSAAEDDLAERSEVTNDVGYALAREFGRGMRHGMRKAEDLDGDGYPDLPEGFTRPCDRDGDGVPVLPDGVNPGWKRGPIGDPEADGEAFGRRSGKGRRHRMRMAEDVDGDGYPDFPEGFIRPCDRDGDGVPDLPDGVTPGWKRGRVDDLEDMEGRPFRGRGRQDAPASETP